MGFVFRGYDENNTPHYDYIPELEKPKENYISKSTNTEPEGLTPVPKSSPPPKAPEIIKPMLDPACPNPLLFFCAGCAVGAVVVIVLNQ